MALSKLMAKKRTAWGTEMQTFLSDVRFGKDERREKRWIRVCRPMNLFSGDRAAMDVERSSCDNGWSPCCWPAPSHATAR